MPKTVKPRTYDSPVRREQALQTRERILEAAHRLFAENGYAGTTIQSMAKAAGVAVDTVYATFGSKPRVLTALLDLRLVETAGPLRVLNSPWAQAIRKEVDQRKQIAMFSLEIVNILERVRPIDDILRSAGAVDPKVAQARAELQGWRARNWTRVVGWIAANGPLRVDQKRAGQIVWALTSPELNQLLRDVQGWSKEQTAAWLEDTLVRILLPDAMNASALGS